MLKTTVLENLVLSKGQTEESSYSGTALISTSFRLCPRSSTYVRRAELLTLWCSHCQGRDSQSCLFRCLCVLQDDQKTWAEVDRSLQVDIALRKQEAQVRAHITWAQHSLRYPSCAAAILAIWFDHSLSDLETLQISALRRAGKHYEQLL